MGFSLEDCIVIWKRNKLGLQGKAREQLIDMLIEDREKGQINEVKK